MLEQTCRTCLATCGELVPIFSNDYYVHNLPEKLFHTTRIEVSEDDDLPKMMCKKCVFLVDSLYCFKDQCEMSEIKLKKTFKCTQNNDVNAATSTYNYEDKDYNKYILGKDHSDAISSSDEDYQVEYVSEEARLEVESARRRSRNAKKRRNRNSGVKVKSVEILPTSSADNIYRNLSSYKSKISEREDIHISDSDDRSSLYVSEGSNNFASNTSDKINYSEPFIDTSEKLNFFKNPNNSFREKLPTTKTGIKRKVESDNSYNQLKKVPKQVIFKENDYNDENIKHIEKTDNWLNSTHNSVPVRLDDDINAIMQINMIENSTEMIKNDDVPTNINYNSPPNSESKKILELRMQNLIKHLSVSIPEVCALCSESFETYTDVLKHKIETHLSPDQDYFFCPVCHKKFFTSDTIIEHLKDHADVHASLCILCSRNCYTEESLRCHMHSHVDLRDLKCEMCTKKFQRIQGLIVHVEQHISPNNLICMLCSDNFDNKNELQTHVHEKHGKYPGEVKIKCQFCGIKISKEEQKDHEKSHHSYVCPYCEESFPIKAALRDHIFTHLSRQQYTCLICEKTFITQEERTQHMQEHMMPQQKADRKKFRCRVCHEILISRAAYGEHLKENHWNSKQTNDILRELSETSLGEQFNQSCLTPSDSLNSV